MRVGQLRHRRGLEFLMQLAKRADLLRILLALLHQGVDVALGVLLLHLRRHGPVVAKLVCLEHTPRQMDVLIPVLLRAQRRQDSSSLERLHSELLRQIVGDLVGPAVPALGPLHDARPQVGVGVHLVVEPLQGVGGVRDERLVDLVRVVRAQVLEPWVERLDQIGVLLQRLGRPLHAVVVDRQAIGFVRVDARLLLLRLGRDAGRDPVVVLVHLLRQWRRVLRWRDRPLRVLRRHPSQRLAAVLGTPAIPATAADVEFRPPVGRMRPPGPGHTGSDHADHPQARHQLPAPASGSPPGRRAVLRSGRHPSAPSTPAWRLGAGLMATSAWHALALALAAQRRAEEARRAWAWTLATVPALAAPAASQAEAQEAASEVVARLESAQAEARAGAVARPATLLLAGPASETPGDAVESAPQAAASAAGSASVDLTGSAGLHTSATDWSAADRVDPPGDAGYAPDDRS